MEEDSDDTGMGPLAAFQLGRWSAEQSQWVRDWKDSLHNPVVAKVHYNNAVLVNQALAAENLRLIDLVSGLENQLAEYRHNYDRLSQWGDEVAKELNKRRAREWAERGQ